MSIWLIGTGISYYLFPPNIAFCQCRPFRDKVIEEESELYCKHIIAVGLAASLDRYQIVEIETREEFLNFAYNKLTASYF